MRRDRRINSYTEFEFREKFKFEQIHARDIMKCWKIFEAPMYRLDSSRHSFHPEEAFLIFLNRQFALKKLSDMEDEFGIDYTTLSRCYNDVSHRLKLAHHNRLFDNLAFFATRFPYYNSKIVAKLAENNQVLPAANAHTCGFQDGTRLHISRPGGDYQLQMRCYNGNDRIHCLEFQAVSFADGMIGDLYGPVCGARHDMHMNTVSNIIARMTAVQLGQPIQYSLYRDKGYIQQPPWGLSAHRNPPAPAVQVPALAAENRLMTSLRIGVEWAFGKVMACNKFVTHFIGLKVFIGPVGDYYCNAVLLANTSTCLYGSLASVYFCGCVPPTLGEYFNEPTVNV